MTLKIRCVSGIGIIDAMFFGLLLTLPFPMGICIFEAYFSSKSIGPKVVRFLIPSGLSAFPLKPLIDLERRPFFKLPK